MRKGLKNYTTIIAIEKTIAEIEELVVQKMSARQFFRDYKDKEVVGVVFVIPTDKGDLPFKLPARVENVENIFYKQKKPRYNWQKPEPLTETEKAQAKRTAWRNVKDWIDAQAALIETDQVKVQEVFLPYLTDHRGVTLAEIMDQGGYKMPALGTGSSMPMEGEVIS